MTMDNKLHLAPLKNPQNVLDIATGTGIWAIEFGQQVSPRSTTPTDLLSPAIPLSNSPRHRSVTHTTRIVPKPSSLIPIADFSSVPPNCQFEINDAEEEWIFNKQFDYIHARAMVSCFRDPPSVLRSIYDSLEPGGWFELQDPIMPLRSVDGTCKHALFFLVSFTCT